MAYRRQRKYAQSTSPSRQSNIDDPQPRRENNDFGFLIDALTRRILESGLMDNKFLKNFFLSKDDQKKDVEEQRNIIERRLNQSIKFSRKPQNQGILRVIQEYAKEKGIPFEEQIKYQQYDILEKPIVVQPTIQVTRDREWIDIFEKFKSENLKIDPNQNLSEIKRIINNNQLTTCQKLQLIIKQRFTIHDASNFPDQNPKVGNKDKDGNIIFMVDEQQIPHRIFFKNREEYEIIDWYLERTNKQSLNLITIDWSKYINNVKKIRGDQSMEKRKIIKIKNQQMQIEKVDQSQFEIIDVNESRVQVSQQNEEKPQIQNQENKQRKPIQLKLKNQFGQLIDKQIQEELQMQRNIQQQEYINDEMMEDLKQILAFDINAGMQPQQNQIQSNNDDYIRIGQQFPKEIKPERITKLSKNKNLEEELKNGRLYLNQEQLTQLDEHISDYLKQVNFAERQIQFKNQIFTLSSPFYIIGDKYPIMMTRQWWYYKNKDCVQQYIIHSQVLWYLYSQFHIKNPNKLDILNQVIAIQMTEYQNRWIQLLQDDGQNLWLETTESSLIKAATENMNELIKQQYDSDRTNYILEVKENIWFTNSSINMICYYHRDQMVAQKSLVIYVKFQGYCYYTNMTSEQIVANMFLFGISFLNSPSFEVVNSIELICWLCGRVFMTWSELYAHECKQCQKLLKVEEILQSWNL